jgi:hypothetical protein
MEVFAQTVDWQEAAAERKGGEKLKRQMGKSGGFTICEYAISCSMMDTGLS